MSAEDAKAANTARGAIEAMLARAVADIGKRELNRGNMGPEIDHLVAGDGLSWCADAVSAWCGIEPPLRSVRAYSPSLLGWAESEGRLLPGPVRGAIFLQQKHCGLVRQVLDGGLAVRTIEGNVGDKVASRRIQASTVTHWIRWWA